MEQILLIKNRQTGEAIEISLAEFRLKFSQELDLAVAKFSLSKADKRPYLPLEKQDYTNDFYFGLRWNFNNLAQSDWYIEKFVK